MSLFWQYFMVPILVFMCVFAIIGFNGTRKHSNKGTILLNGAFTGGLLLVTVLSLYDLFIGL